MRFDVACDLGGGFLDVVAVAGDERRIVKCAHDDTLPALLLRALHAIDIAPDQVMRVRLSSTLAANALLAGKAAPVALVTSAGFIDLPDLGRQSRRDPDADPPPPPTPPWLSPRGWRFGLRGRVDAMGEAVEALILDDLDVLLNVPQGTPVAICLLFAHLNPAHEIAAAAHIAALRPDLPLSLSHQVDPAPREFERMLATLADASLKPLAQAYTLPSALPTPWVMRAEGGLAPLMDVLARPLGLVSSGPAAGALAVARCVPEGAAIGLDIGITTTEVSLHRDGVPLRARQVQLGEMMLRGACLHVESLAATTTLNLPMIAEAVRRIAWRAGIDPAQATLVVGGGAGPDLAPALVEALAPRHWLVPEEARVMAATGLHHAPALALQRLACDVPIARLPMLRGAAAEHAATLRARLAGWGCAAPMLTHELDLAPHARAAPIALLWHVDADTSETLATRARGETTRTRGHAPPGTPRIVALRSTAWATL